MQRDEAHIYFLETVGMGDWFWGTTLNDVRYCVEGESLFMGGEPVFPAKVVLHFPACKGGDVLEGYGIYNYFRGLAAKGIAIEARVEGLCASIATLIALSADTVLMADASLWMVHKPASSGGGTADELRAEADILDKIQAQLVSRYVARCGGKLDAATANELINKESWLNADECVAYGFASGKLPDAPITVPEGADAVLNYFPTTKQPAAMAITPAEETRLVDRFINAAKEFFAPKNEAAPVVEPVATNTTTEVADGDPIYSDGELATSVAVYSDEALTIAYPDGVYTLGDGREVTVAGGTVEELSDAADAAADLAATNTALEAANARIAELEASNSAQALNITGLTNRLNKVVPGSTGNPTPAGSTQNLVNKPGVPAPAGNSLINIRRS